METRTRCKKYDILHGSKSPLTQLSQRLKAALWFSIGKIVDEETLKLGVNATPQFIGALTEMVWAQIGTILGEAILKHRNVKSAAENVSQDLESFSKCARVAFYTNTC